MFKTLRNFKVSIKSTLLLFAIVGMAQFAQAQHGIGVTNPHASAALEISSTNKGILFPRMTTAQRDAIGSPAEGLMIYNTTTNCINTFRGGAWKSNCDANDMGVWGLTGNTATSPGTHFLGTTDAQDLIFKTNGTERMRILSTGEIGMNVTAPTNRLHINATNPARFEGLQAGVNTDEIMTVDATGVLRKRSLANILLTADPMTFTNLVTFNGGITSAGPNILNGTTTVTGTTNLNTTGTGTTNIGNCAGPAITNIDGATNINTACGSTTTIGNTTNGVTNISGTTGVTGVTNINTTGTAATNIGATGGATNITGTTTVTGATNLNTTGSGVTTLGNASATTNVVGATNINTTGSGITTVGNASSTTNIAGNTLNITNLPSGSGADSVLVIDPTTGRAKKVSMAMVGANAFTADNGLTKTASNVQLGGTLIQNTTVTLANFNMNFATTGTGNVGVNAATPNSKFQVNGSFATRIATKSANYTADATDHIIIVDASGGNRTITLPSAVGLDGRQYIIKKKDSSANSAIIAAAGSETIDGDATVSLTMQWSVRTIVSDGANWMIISNQ
jgi:hypothetical protein